MPSAWWKLQKYSTVPVCGNVTFTSCEAPGSTVTFTFIEVIEKLCGTDPSFLISNVMDCPPEPCRIVGLKK